MKARKLSVDGDYSFGNNKQDYATGSEAVAEAIRSKVLLFYGEWWENLGSGIPMFQSIIGQVNKENVKNSMQLLLAERIMEVPKVTSVNSVVVTLDGRTATASINVSTASSEKVELEVRF